MVTRTADEKHYFTRLFHQYHRPLYAYACKKTKDSFAAEEIVQLTFIKFWKHQQKNNFPDQDNPEKLLFFITKALLVDYYRKKATTISIDQSFAAREELKDNSLTQQQEALHFNTLVRSAANTLPERQRQIFEMNYFGGLSHQEVAIQLNISRQTVKNLLVKAMKQVQVITARHFMYVFIGIFCDM